MRHEFGRSAICLVVADRREDAVSTQKWKILSCVEQDDRCHNA